MSDLELKGEFSDLDWSVVDFRSGDWSWGFGADSTDGEIRHCVSDDENHRFILTRYPIPRAIADIIVQSREGAANNLRRRLLDLKEQESRLLSIKADGS